MPLLQTPNPNVFAAALTQVVKRARIAVLGPLVSMTNPVRVAEEFAMLDQLSKGRLVMLFLRGTPNEFLAYGVNPDETRARTQEASTLIVRALTEPEPFGWEGRFFQFRTIAVWPGPIQRPHPPVFYSGNSLESANFAAANHFGLGMSYYPPHMVAQLAAHYRLECAKHGWQPMPDQLIYRTFVGVADSDKTAAEMKTRFFGLSATVASMVAGRGSAIKALTPFGAAQALSADGREKHASGPDQGQAGFGFGELQFCGGPDTVVRQLTEFHASTGVGVIDVSFGGAGLTAEEADRSFRLFSGEVLPRIRSIGADQAPRALDEAPVQPGAGR
jgi:alkanesulfonate monooxygenase SsuD/methylene tetrahydromethanopterin reductase-like flavin-dependent oxidoreductase (luciferase family)